MFSLYFFLLWKRFSASETREGKVCSRIKFSSWTLIEWEEESWDQNTWVWRVLSESLFSLFSPLYRSIVLQLALQIYFLPQWLKCIATGNNDSVYLVGKRRGRKSEKLCEMRRHTRHTENTHLYVAIPIQNGSPKVEKRREKEPFTSRRYDDGENGERVWGKITEKDKNDEKDERRGWGWRQIVITWNILPSASSSFKLSSLSFLSTL